MNNYSVANKIYSLNLVAYLKMQGIEPNHRLKDENDKICFVFDDDISFYKDEYHTRSDLRAYANAYAQVKKEIHELKTI